MESPPYRGEVRRQDKMRLASARIIGAHTDDGDTEGGPNPRLVYHLPSRFLLPQRTRLHRRVGHET